MIKITRDKNVLTIEFDSGVGWITRFTRTSNSELDAILLKSQLEKQLSGRITTLKEKAYERGYNDKTKRKARDTWQSSNIDNLDA